MFGNDQFVKLLLHCDGANNSTTFLDNAAGAATPHTMSAAGNAKINTAAPKFGTGQALFDGAAGSIITTPSNSDIIPGGDYTIDFWASMTNLASTMGFLSKGPSATFCGPYFFRMVATTGVVQFFSSSNGTTFDIANAQTIGTIAAAGVYHHIAIVRSGNTYFPFFDGTVGTTFNSSATPFSSSDQLVIGAAPDGTTAPLNGVIDELRISIGIARWTSSFSVAKEPYDAPTIGAFANNIDDITVQSVIRRAEALAY